MTRPVIEPFTPRELGRLRIERPDLFWTRFEPGLADDECWEWQGYRNPAGYGYATIKVNGHERNRVAHKVAWEIERGFVPAGLTLDHLCRNRACCNPNHLEPVTHRENILRGEGIAPKRLEQTHCVHGHLLSGDNLIARKDSAGRLGRKCRECKRRLAREYERRKRANAKAHD